MTVAGGFLWKTDMSSLHMRVTRFFVRLRTVYGHEPWGDQAIFVRKAAFDTVGGFGDVPVAEDWDLIRTLKRRGRIASVRKEIITSSRRWQRLGVIRSFLTNRLIILGCLLRLPRRFLARLY